MQYVDDKWDEKLRDELINNFLFSSIEYIKINRKFKYDPSRSKNNNKNSSKDQMVKMEKEKSKKKKQITTLLYSWWLWI